MFTVAICINFLFLFIRSFLSSLLSFSFLLFFFPFLLSALLSLCFALFPSVSSQRLSALLSLSNWRQPNLWRWLFEDGVVLVGWWLWVCGLRFWWCGFAGVGMVGLGGCHGIRWRGFGFADVGCGGFGFADVGIVGLGGSAWVWVCRYGFEMDVREGDWERRVSNKKKKVI